MAVVPVDQDQRVSMVQMDRHRDSLIGRVSSFNFDWLGLLSVIMMSKANAKIEFRIMKGHDMRGLIRGRSGKALN